MTSKAVPSFLWFCLFIVPLSYNIWGLDPALYSKYLLLDVALILGGVFTYWASKKPVAVSRRSVIFIGIYLAYILISLPGMVLYGINNADGWFVWLQLAVCPAFVLLLLTVDQMTPIKRQEVAGIISTLTAVSIFIGAVQYGVAVFSNGWSLSSSDAMKGTFAHKNIFAEVLLLTLPFSFYSGFIQKQRIHQVVAMSTVLAIIVSLSRAVWLGGAVALISCIVIYLISRKTDKINLKQIFLFATVIFLSIFVSYWFIKHTGMGSKVAYFYNGRNTINERAHLWNATWQIIKVHPWVGSGLGSWKVLNMQYGIVGLRNYVTFFQQPHNDSLWILSEQGLLGFIAIAIAWLYLMYILLQRIRLNPNDTFLYCLLFAVVGYWGYSNFSFPRERAEHGIIMAFIAFFILREDKPSENYSVGINKYILLFLFVLLEGGLWWAGNKLYGEIELRHFFEARAKNDLDAELIHLNNIKPAYCTLDGTATPIAWYRGMAHFAQNDIDEASIDFDNAVKANPYHAYSLANVGTCLSLKNKNEEATKYFRASLFYSPGFPEAALNLAAIKFNMKQTDSAAYYTGMANDSLSDTRYKQFITVVMRACINPMIDSATTAEDTVLLMMYKNISKNDTWMMHICKDAYVYKRSIPAQINRDVIWSVRYDARNPALAEKLKKSLKLDL